MNQTAKPRFEHLGPFSDLVTAARALRPLFPSAPPGPETRRKAMDARLIAITSLTRAGQPIAPERVESVKGSGGRVRLFLFPRSLALDKSTEELAFQTALGPMAVKTKFNLKDMSQSAEPGL